MHLFFISSVVFGQIYLAVAFPSSYGGQGTGTSDQNPVKVEVRLSEAENPTYRDEIPGSVQDDENHEAIYDYYSPHHSQVEVPKETGRFDESKHHQRMHLRMLKEPGAPVCNDGTQAGYYLLKNSGNSHWVISLQGGWYCYDEASCRMRMMQTPNLMGSRNWVRKKLGSGILSPYSSENPHLWRSSMVYVPYCSSDTWSGDGSVHRFQNRDVYFMGSKIIDEVIKDLAKNHGLLKASVIILTGSSAGGTGVLLNLDRIQKLVHSLGSEAKVRGIIDSSWYLLRPETENEVTCDSGSTCSPVASLKIGVQLWNPLLPEGCANNPANRRDGEDNETGSGGSNITNDNRWRCFFGQQVYPHVKSPLFVIQWLFDEVQLNSDRIDILNLRTLRENRRFWQYITELEKNMRDSLKSVSAVFAPACVSHAILEKREWVTTSVKQTRLPDAVKCWENSLDRQHKPQASKKIPQLTNPFKSQVPQQSNNLNTSQAEAPTNSSQWINKTKRQINSEQYQSNDNIQDPPNQDKTGNAQPVLASDASDVEDYYYFGDYRYVEYLNDYPSDRGWDTQYGDEDREEEPPPTNEESKKKCGDLQLIETCFGPLCNPTCPPVYFHGAGSLMNGHETMAKLSSNINELAKSSEDSRSLLGMLHAI